MTDAPVLSLEHVSRRFGQARAVDDVSFAVARGEFFALLGPSGCGKTTTLRLIAGFDRPEPDGGVVRMLGEPMNDRRPYQRPIGMVFQHYALFPHLDVAGNIAFGLQERRVARGEIRERVTRALELVRLDPAAYATRRPAELSGGQRQRVALARALVLEPPILLLDEPLGALDLQLRKEMQLELKALNRTLGITFVLVTHDQEEALAMSDRVAVMSAGRVAQIGTPAAVYGAPRTTFVAGFIGEANILAGAVSAVRSGLATVTQADGCTWQLATDGAISVGTPVCVAIRPEWHTLLPAATASPGVNALRGVVREVVFRGESSHVLVTLPSGGVLRVATRDGAWQAGDAVAVTWRADQARILEA
ncbi:MAG TPA: ABC transporter ATP-binding protein [Gemmatimonadales bacterium]|nr:ABC transporter ATP-binding protein [Gemmatimonadales bacterium]